MSIDFRDSEKAKEFMKSLTNFWHWEKNDFYEN